MPFRDFLSSRLGIAAAAAVVLVAVLAIGVVIGMALQDGGSRTPSQATGKPATTTASDTATVVMSPTLAPSATATGVPTPEPPRQVSLPSPTPTVACTLQPAIQVAAVSPALGTHIEQATVDIAIDVQYQAGCNSNVLTWHILYCASPIDCNTYGGEGGVAITPGAAGSATLSAPFAAGGNYLRPIVICQYTVEIGHFLTPEAQWQTQLANDDRCHPPDTVPRVKVTGVIPELGTTLNAGDTISVNLEYDAGPATRVEARYSVENCAGDLYAFRSAPVTPGTSGVTTILVPVTPKAVGPLRHIEARLMNGDTVIATYNFGPCQG
jgi:hypothetical protein